jgi:hypothetical protein
VTNPQVGDNLTYQPTEPSESLYKGMSGGAVLNEAGQLLGIHVGLTKVGGDGKGVLISTFLRIAPPEVEEVLVRSTPDVLSSSSSDNKEVKLRRQLEEERRKREEAEGRVEKLEAKLFKEAEGRQQEGEKKIKNDKKRFCLWGYVWWSWFFVWFVWALLCLALWVFGWCLGWCLGWLDRCFELHSGPWASLVVWVVNILVSSWVVHLTFWSWLSWRYFFIWEVWVGEIWGLGVCN